MGIFTGFYRNNTIKSEGGGESTCATGVDDGFRDGLFVCSVTLEAVQTVCRISRPSHRETARAGHLMTAAVRRLSVFLQLPICQSNRPSKHHSVNKCKFNLSKVTGGNQEFRQKKPKNTRPSRETSYIPPSPKRQPTPLRQRHKKDKKKESINKTVVPQYEHKEKKPG